MYIRRVILLDNVEEKIWSKHNVSADEVYELFDGRPHIVYREKGMAVEGEDMYTALGRTFAGRYLIVFFIYKLTKDALIVTARDMNKSERKYYAKIKH
jgi:uncharacterized DUF497 family protein